MAGDEQHGLHGGAGARGGRPSASPPRRRLIAQRQRVLVGGERLLAAALPGEVRGDGRARALGGLAQPVGVGQQLVDALGEALDVAGRHEHEAVAGGGDLLGAGLAAAADRGHAAGHRLDVGHAERLLGRGHHEQRARGARARSPRAGVELAVELDPLGDAQARGERLRARRARGRRRRSRSAASDGAATEHRQRAQHVGVALARDQVRDRHERRRGAPRGRVARAARARAGRRRGARRASRARRGRAPARRCPGCWRAPGGRRRGRARPRCAPAASRAAPCRARRRRARRRPAARARGAGARRTASPAGTALWAWTARTRTRGAAGAARARAPAPPRLPSGVGALARRRDVGHVGDRQAVARLRARLAQRARRARARPRRGPLASEARGGTRRCSTSTCTSAPASRAASAWRWAQMPSTGSRRLG